jgi:hypothetical protein
MDRFSKVIEHKTNIQKLIITGHGGMYLYSALRLGQEMYFMARLLHSEFKPNLGNRVTVLKKKKNKIIKIIAYQLWQVKNDFLKDTIYRNTIWFWFPFISVYFFSDIFLLYWGYIVTFTKVLTIHHS